MSLTAKDVAEITRLLEDSSFSELHLELDGLKLSIRRQSPSADTALSDPAGSLTIGAPATLTAVAPSPRTATPCLLYTSMPTMVFSSTAEPVCTNGALPGLGAR